MFKTNLSWSMRPNVERAVYDAVVAFAAALFVYAFLNAIGHAVVAIPLLTAPALLLIFNLAFGVFTKFKVSSGLVKSVVLTAACTAMAAVMILLGQDVASAILLAAFCVVLTTLPRIFLGIKKGSRVKLVKTALKRRGPILVVGGAGYIGSHVVDVLLKANHRVRVLDKIMYNRKTIADFINHPNFELIEGDATDISKLVMATQDASAVVHLAGLVGDPACAVDDEFTRHTNVITTRMVKEIAISSGVERFIFSSSCSVYGANDEIVNETSELNPVSLYAITKIDSEKELLRAGSDEFHPTILRFATVYGHSRRPRFDLVGNLFTAQAFNDGKLNVMGPNQWRPFVHCRDLARAIELVIRSPINKVHNQIFNVGDDRLNMTIGDLANKVANVAKAKGRAVELMINDNVTDRRNYRVSFVKIKSILGFEASIDIETGVKEIYEAFERGDYGDFRNKSYSNVEVTKLAVDEFHDPLHTANLYRPLNEEINKRVIAHTH